MADETGGRPCDQCGADVPEGRSVCPSCSTMQRVRPAPATAAPAVGAAPAQEAPAAGPPSPPGPGAGASFRATPAPLGAPAHRTRRGGSPAPFAIAVLVIIAALVGGAYVVSQREDPTPTSAAEEEPDDPQSDLEEAMERAEEIGHSLTGVDRTTSTIASSTTAPPEDIEWSEISDPVSGLRWSMPGTDIIPSTDVIGLSLGGPTGHSKTWAAFDYGLSVDVTVWGPSGKATQADVDEMMQFDKDLHHRINEPYGKALTIAGQPTVAVLSTPEPDSAYVATAVVDGALVRIQISSSGTPLDPAIFERIVTSFAKS